MDSERRHELEENQLARALRRTPEFIRDYGSYVLLGLAVALAVFWVYRSRVQSAEMERQASAQGLYNMVNLVEQAEQLASLAPVMSAGRLQEQQASLDEQFQQFSPLTADSPVPGTVSHGLRLRGDFAWVMATMPEPMGEEAPTTAPTTGPASDLSSLLDGTSQAPTTQPGIADRSPDDWLSEAAAAYQQVVDRYPGQQRDVIAARFALAAIHEQRGEFDQAGQQYAAIQEMEQVPGSIASLARERQSLLQHLAMNVRLAEPATRPETDPAADPAADPGLSTPTTPGPTTAPATQPSTQPTTAPAPR